MAVGKAAPGLGPGSAGPKPATNSGQDAAIIIHGVTYAGIFAFRRAGPGFNFRITLSRGRNLPALMTSQQRIRLARRHAAMSQTQLAQAVGVQRSAVSHWEAPQGKNPSVKHLREISMVTGVQFEWLATGRGQMAPSRESVLDSVSAVDALLVDDSLEQRLLMAFREAPVRARLALVELMEELASQRTGRPRTRSLMAPDAYYESLD